MHCVAEPLIRNFLDVHLIAKLAYMSVSKKKESEQSNINRYKKRSVMARRGFRRRCNERDEDGP